jgi:hypothetical protein
MEKTVEKTVYQPVETAFGNAILDNIPETLERLPNVKQIPDKRKPVVKAILNYFKENPEQVYEGVYASKLVTLMEKTGNYAVRNDANKILKEILN